MVRSIVVLIILSSIFSPLANAGKVKNASFQDLNVVVENYAKQNELNLISREILGAVAQSTYDESEKLTFNELLKILYLYEYTAFVDENSLTVIPAKQARTYPLEKFKENYNASFAYAWSEIHLKKACANTLIPVLRPTIPAIGHLAAHNESNTIFVVDTNKNIERLITAIAAIEKNTTTLASCTNNKS